MAAMGDIWTLHECDTMSARELDGLSTLIDPEAEGPLTGAEVAAVRASPVLRAWLPGVLASYGPFALREVTHGRRHADVLGYLGARRAELHRLAVGA